MRENGQENPRVKYKETYLVSLAGEWVVITVVTVLVNREWRVEVVWNSEDGVWVEPDEVEDRRGEKPEVVMAEKESGTGLEEKSGVIEAEEVPGTVVQELSDDTVVFSDSRLIWNIVDPPLKLVCQTRDGSSCRGGNES